MKIRAIVPNKDKKYFLPEYDNTVLRSPRTSQLVELDKQVMHKSVQMFPKFLSERDLANLRLVGKNLKLD
jgi:hypothetical protein